MKWFINLLLISLLLAGCGLSEKPSKENLSDEPSIENVTESTSQDEQFSFRLVSEKAQYKVGEPVNIQAELTYIGEQDSINIAHAASPIGLLTTNLTEDYQFQAAMNEPLIRTNLVKNEPFIEPYHFTGGSYYEGMPGEQYSDEIFNKMASGKFPPGQYEIKGQTDFSVGEDIQSKKIKLETKIIFTVTE